jgi:hypothetical protein
MSQRAGKRFDVWLPSDLYDALSAQSEQEGRPMRAIVEEYVRAGMARTRGEELEQRALPLMREIVSTELRKANAQLYTKLSEGLQADLLAEIKTQGRRSDDRLAALSLRAIREGGIAWRLVYALIARQLSPTIAGEAYQDAKAKAGESLKQSAKGEG